MSEIIEEKEPIVERHPFQPFIPKDATMLIMGTFPPKPNRWAMEFYYPNRTNDFWRMMGLVFFDNEFRFYDPATKQFLVHDIKIFLEERGIALSDTGARARRLRDNASDKFLDIVETVNLESLMSLMPNCRYIATTGEKAAEIIAQLTSTEAPKMGACVKGDFCGRELEMWRMPSTSRAYPLAVAAKAEFYKRFFKSAGVI